MSNYMKKFKEFLKQLRLTQVIYNKIDRIKESSEYIIGKAKMKKQVLYIFTPTHVNLGDLAIAEATTRYLDYLKIKYFEINDEFLYRLKRERKLNLMNGSTILIHGGGFLGTLWFNAEQVTREIIRQNPESNIVILPNTIYYEDSKWGQCELNKSIDIYNSHNKLTIFVREKISYDTMRNRFKNLKLVPDMVLSMNKSENQFERNGCLVCLRSDKEGTLTKEHQKTIEEQINSLFGYVKITDMYADGVEIVEKQSREEEVNKKFDEFKRAQLVVTDRLHGMIFAAITGTPCIVINSLSHKLKGCYEWIKDLEYIKFCDDMYKIKETYLSIPEKTFCYDNSRLMMYYNELEKELKKVCQK